jgi:hypothetical protein
MNETELTRIALAEWTDDVRPRVLADIADSDGSSSIYGWHVYLPGELIDLWPSLSMDQRLVAYIMANSIAGDVG